MNSLPFAKRSVLFAPMEGVTDSIYRKVVGELYPDWDYFCCDFLRAPGVGSYSRDKVLSHYGKEIYDHPTLRLKNGYQILTTPEAYTESLLEKINELKFTHLDLNLGCPSKKVNSHFGGAYLLSDLEGLEKVLRLIRSHFSGNFTVKMRAGYRDTLLFKETLSLIEACGVEAITVHARTRDQLYRGEADWSLISKAVEWSNLPIIGNGDLWHPQDIERMFCETDCYAVMCARGALGTPWMAELYRHHKEQWRDQDFLTHKRFFELNRYFTSLDKAYRESWEIDDVDYFLLRRFKGLSRYLFMGLPEGEQLKSKVLRAQELQEIYTVLNFL